MPDPQDCYGFEPTDYMGQANPQAIMFSIYAFFLYTFYLVVFVVYDYRSRRMPLQGVAEEASLTHGDGLKFVMPYPTYVWYIIVWITSNAAVGNFLQIVFFYGLRSGSTEAEQQMACYLQWYSKGGTNTIFHGNFNIVFVPLMVLYILGAVAYFRIKHIKKCVFYYYSLLFCLFA
jgi:hypothetical protein